MLEVLRASARMGVVALLSIHYVFVQDFIRLMNLSHALPVHWSATQLWTRSDLDEERGCLILELLLGSGKRSRAGRKSCLRAVFLEEEELPSVIRLWLNECCFEKGFDGCA